MGWEVGGMFKRERTYVYLWLIHTDVWQRPAQCCETIILQLKIKKKEKWEKKKKINSLFQKKKKREREREPEREREKREINLIVWSETYFRISTHFMNDFPEPR